MSYTIGGTWKCRLYKVATGKFGIELISPEGYKVKETEEVSKLREIFASQSDENKVFFLNKVELETFLSQQEKRKEKWNTKSG